MRFRLASSLAVAVVVLTVSTACTPEPAPTPTPTGFATEEEAFAAAEQTYREYVDALNQVDLADPDTFEAVFRWTTGAANAADRRGFSDMHAEGLTVEGQSQVALVALLSADEVDFSSVDLATCLDVSSVTLTDSEGNSAIEPDRADVASYLVTLQASGDSPTGMLINGFDGREGEPTCQP